MTTLQEALISDARDHAERLRVVMQDQAAETIESLCDALAQQDNTVTALRSQAEYLEKIVEDQAKVLEQQDHIPDAGKMVPLTDDEIFAIAHRTATRYTHFVQPGQVMYGFAQHHMIDLVRAIEAAHCIGEFK